MSEDKSKSIITIDPLLPLITKLKLCQCVTVHVIKPILLVLFSIAVLFYSLVIFSFVDCTYSRLKKSWLNFIDNSI